MTYRVTTFTFISSARFYCRTNAWIIPQIIATIIVPLRLEIHRSLSSHLTPRNSSGSWQLPPFLSIKQGPPQLFVHNRLLKYLIVRMQVKSIIIILSGFITVIMAITSNDCNMVEQNCRLKGLKGDNLTECIAEGHKNCCELLYLIRTDRRQTSREKCIHREERV